ncbi:unnamed protein product [Rotaria sp. Silwood2]|nr:unnamed protein product [Rotaria sp. Silwood2]CAF4462201.1 unnamed protein product [Rotaria sp. Silwood2]
MTSTRSNLCEEISKFRTSFEKLRTEINAKLSECNNYIGLAEKLCRQATQMTNNREDKLANLSNEEKEWEEIDVELATMSVTRKVKLDVGGDIYATSVEVLTREKDTFFTALFSKQWELQCDPIDTSIFIDRDGKLFAHILAYMRTDQVPDDTMKNELLRRSLIIEAEYFRLHDLLKILTIFPNGTLLEREQKMKLNEFYGNRDQRWQLIYKASRDGFDTNAFHSRCDNKGPTMTIVRSNNNYLFGGYTSVDWTSSAGIGYKNDTTAFLFTLTNPHNIPPTKYQIDPTKAATAVWYGSGCGPWFGEYDLGLVANSNSNNSSYTQFPSSYIDTSGKGNNTFTGARNFITSDIEVFQLA